MTAGRGRADCNNDATARVEINGSLGAVAFDLERLNELEFYDATWDCFRALNAIGYAGLISVEWEDAGMDRLIRAPEALAFVRKPALDASAAPRSTPHSRGRTEAGAGPVNQPVAGPRLVGEDSVRPSPFSPAVCHHPSQ